MVSFILPGNSASGGFNVANSLRFNDDDSPSLTRTDSSGTSRRTFSYSVWVKKSQAKTDTDSNMIVNNASDESNQFKIELEGDHPVDNNDIRIRQMVSGSQTVVLKTNRSFRDPSAWMHILVAVDTTQGTEANRIKIYINGVQETSFSSATYPSLNSDMEVNVSGSYTTHIGKRNNNDHHFDGYMCEFVFIDGQALDPTSFGEFDEDSVIWKPIDVSGLTFGNNGFYLDFEDSSNLGNDKNGGTDLTEVNLAATDQSTDTCTNNFCTLNPLSKGTITLSEGNLQWQGSGDNGGKGTFLMTAGKWYWEMKRGDSEDNVGFGVAVSNWTNAVDAASGEAWYGYQGQAYKVSGSGEVSYGATFTNNDIVSCLFNADDGILAFYKNGASQGNAYTGLTNSDGYVPIYFTYRSSVTNYMNFGSPIHSISSGNSDANGYGNFEYAVPSGYFALCSKNLAEYG